MPLESERVMRGLKINFASLQDLADLVIRGFDDDGNGGDTGGSGGTDDSGSGDNTGDNAGDNDTSGGEDDTGDDDVPDNAEELKKALKAERELRKKAEKGQKLTGRELAKLKKAQDDIQAAEEGEVAAAKKKAEDSETKTKNLAAKLRQSSLERAIIDAARTAKFRDPDDVITQLQRSNFEGIEIDQDEDDPSDIEIDAKSVEKAVKKIATAKPHWLLAAGETGPSGSSFNGAKPGDKDKPKQAEYVNRFPALRNRVPRS